MYKRQCVISHVEKTKVSRAVTALETAGLLLRTPSKDDRRAEFLSLTDKGLAIFRELGQRGKEYDRTLRENLGDDASSQLIRSLEILMKR